MLRKNVREELLNKKRYNKTIDELKKRKTWVGGNKLWGDQNEGEDNWGRADNRRKSGFVLQVRFFMTLEKPPNILV